MNLTLSILVNSVGYKTVNKQSSSKKRNAGLVIPKSVATNESESWITWLFHSWDWR
jgi:hypothetical protein